MKNLSLWALVFICVLGFAPLAEPADRLLSEEKPCKGLKGRARQICKKYHKKGCHEDCETLKCRRWTQKMIEKGFGELLPDTCQRCDPVLCDTILGSFELLETVPHDSSAFTQGLELVPNNAMYYYESTGLYGKSSMRIVSLTTGEAVEETELADSLFGEGATFLPKKDQNPALLQLTWKAGTGLVYDAVTLERVGEFPIDTTSGQGWGICADSTSQVLYVSDGTSNMHVWDAKTFELQETIPVVMAHSTTENNETPISRLNELEWDHLTNTILANVWQTNYIVRIDPKTGGVTHRYDLSRLQRPQDADVLNGIAQTDVENEVWVTGKLWPQLYRVRLIDE